MNYFNNLPLPPIAIYFILLWSLFWKGLALWTAVKNDQRNWFIVILVLNTVGLLEILYLFILAKKKFNLKDLKFWK